MIIGIIGKKYHGKDTVAEFMKECGHFEQMAFAEPLKEACRALFSFDDDQLYGDKKEVVDEFWKITPRKVYEFIGTDICRKQMNTIIPVKEDFWVECMRRRLKNVEGNIIISDIRFPNEAKLVKDMGGFTIKVSRPVIEDDDDQHESESLIDCIDFDYAINNTGSLEELRLKVHLTMELLFRS